jgi:hypothetical protein
MVALVRLETVLISASDRCTVFAGCTIGMQFILVVPDVLQCYVVKWMLVSIYLEIVLTLTQDRCMVCPKQTTGS